MAWSSNNNRPPSAAGGGFAAAVVVAGKAGKTGPGQTKPRLGTTGKPAKPNAKQGGFINQKFPGGVLIAEGFINPKLRLDVEDLFH